MHAVHGDVHSAGQVLLQLAKDFRLALSGSEFPSLVVSLVDPAGMEGRGGLVCAHLLRLDGC